MKHIMGNSVQCRSCFFFRDAESDLLPCRCINPNAQCCNGRVNPHPLPFMRVYPGISACCFYVECETGFTRFELLVGKHEDDFSPIDFDNEICLWRLL